MKSENRVSKIFNNSFVLALIFIVPNMVAFLLTDPKLSGAGDLNIAEFLMSEGKIKDGVFYISPMLSKFLRLFCKLIYLNWWSIFSVFVLVSGLFFCLWFIAKRMKEYPLPDVLIALALFDFLYWELVLKGDINFTQSCSVASVVGLLLLFDYCLSYEYKSEKEQQGLAYKKIKVQKIVTLIAAFVSFWISGEIRKLSFIMCIPFGIMVLMYFYIFPLKSNNLLGSLKASWNERKRSVWMIAYLIAVLFVVFGAYKIYETDETVKKWIDTNEAGCEICDYIGCYPDYFDEKEIYDNIGIPWSWLAMIKETSFSDENVFSSETMHLMQPLKGKSNLHISDYSNYFSNNKLFWLLLTLFVAFIFRKRGKRNVILPLIGATFGVICCSVYFIYIGRIAWRVSSSYLLLGIISFVAMSFTNFEITEIESSGSKDIDSEFELHKKIEFIALFSMLVFVWILAVKDEKNTFSLPKREVVNLNQSDVLDYIDADDNNVYLYDDLIRYVGAHSVWSGHAPDYLDNYFPLTSCFVFGCKDKLAEYGIEDLYKSIISMPNVRVENQVFTTDILFEYLKDFYNPFVSMSIVENIKGNLYIRFSEPIIPEDEQKVNIEYSIRQNNEITSISNVKSMFDVEASFSSEDAINYKDILVNIYLDDGTIHTFGLNYSDAKATGTILFTWDDANLMITKMELIGCDNNGHFHILAGFDDSIYCP